MRVKSSASLSQVTTVPQVCRELLVLQDLQASTVPTVKTVSLVLLVLTDNLVTQDRAVTLDHRDLLEQTAQLKDLLVLQAILPLLLDHQVLQVQMEPQVLTGHQVDLLVLLENQVCQELQVARQDPTVRQALQVIYALDPQALQVKTALFQDLQGMKARQDPQDLLVQTAQLKDRKDLQVRQ